MNKICTTIEQSKKLIELGIDIDTADMCYINGKPNIGFLSEEYKMFGDNVLTDYWPAWSLGALLTLVPNETLINDEYYYLNLNKTNVEYRGPVTFDGQKTKSFECNNLMDAAFEMVCWLKENGKL